jgi:sugar phosphate isomerase/epimerase
MKDTFMPIAARRFSIAQNSLCNLGMERDIDMLVEAGMSTFGAMGSIVRHFGTDRLLDLMQHRGLTLSSYHAGLRLIEMTVETAAEALALNLRIASRLGARFMSVSPGPSGALSADEADAIYVARLTAAAPLARELGVTMLVEPLHPLLRTHGYIHSLLHGLEIVSQVPECAIMLDLVQIYWNRGLLSDVARHAKRIGVVQLGNLDRAALSEKRWLRASLADGDIDLRAFIHALEVAGYTGFYEMENPLGLAPVECIAAIRAAYEFVTSHSAP